MFFSFVAINAADSDDGVDHRLVLAGAGILDPEGGKPAGGGDWVHFTPDGSVIDFGTWTVKNVLDFRPCTPDTCETGIGSFTFGNFRPGVLTVEVNLESNEVGEIEGLTLTIVCNIFSASIFNKDPVTGATLPEGYFLTIPDGIGGTLEFKPLGPPPVGLTFIGVDPGVNLD
ncbi:MAG: hypothetical protein V3T78_00580 [Dehalococcoidia bacterium]